MCKCKKYCNAQVVMLRTVLKMAHMDIVEATGIPSQSVGNTISRRCPNEKAANRCKRRDTRITVTDIDGIQADYLNGLSTYDIGKKYDINHSTVSKLMKKRGLSRGKHKGAAFERSRKKQHEDAVRRWVDEYGIVPDEATHGKRPRAIVRKQRISSRSRDSGINWKSLAERNGSMRCEICGIECDPNDRSWGTSGPTHPSVDHIKRICDGGNDTWDNSRLTCCSCNLRLNAERQKEVDDAEEQAAARQ